MPKIKKLLFILSIIFIFFIILLSIALNPKSYPPEKLSSLTIRDKDKAILTIGQIESIDYNQDYTFFYLKNSSVKLIVFTRKFIDLKEDQQVEIKGRLDFYKNKTQILVDKIVI